MLHLVASTDAISQRLYYESGAVLGLAGIVGLLIAGKRWGVKQIERVMEEFLRTNKKLKNQNKKAKADREMLHKISYELGENGGRSLKDGVNKAVHLNETNSARLDRIEQLVGLAFTPNGLAENTKRQMQNGSD